MIDYVKVNNTQTFGKKINRKMFDNRNMSPFYVIMRKRIVKIVVYTQIPEKSTIGIKSVVINYSNYDFQNRRVTLDSKIRDTYVSKMIMGCRKSSTKLFRIFMSRFSATHSR